MLENHKILYKVNKPALYRKWLNQKAPDALKRCGTRLVSAEEKEEGVWSATLEIDVTHPNHEDVVKVMPNAGFIVELLKVPKVALACKEEVTEILKDLRLATEAL